MNKRLLPLVFTFLFLSTLATAQTVTISSATGGLAGTPQLAGNSNIAIFGVQLNKATGGGNTVTSITVAMTTTPVNKFTNARLYESTDATFSGVGTETLIGSGTISATDISFTGSPLTSFDGATAAADDEFFFIVVDVDPTVTAATVATQPSLANTGVAVTTGSAAGATITGTNYAFVAPQTTIANLSTGLAASPLQAAASSQGVFGFSLTSTGTQTVTALNIQVTSTPIGKWGSYSLITSTDNDFSTTGDNSAAIGGLTFTPSATQIAITGLSQSITTSTTNYFLVVNVDPAVTAATPAVQPSLAAANATASTGTFTGTATGTSYSFTAPQTTIANLSTGLAGSPLQAGATNQGVFGFSLTSTGTQTLTALNIQVTSTPIGKWGSYSLITSTDNSFATTGDNSAPIGGLTITPSATQITITGLSQSITSSATNFFLVVNVDPAVNGSTASVTPSLGAANATASSGTFTGTATGTAYSFAPLLTIANLTTGLATSPLIAGSANQGVFGFSLTSSGSQTVTVANIQLTSTPSAKWTNYRLITSTDASYATGGDNSAPIGGLTFTPSASQVAITGLSEVVTTGTNYFLVVDIDPAVTGATTAVQPSLASGNITITTGGGIATGSATGTSYSFSAATATFTQITVAPVLSGTVLSAGTTQQVLTGFSVTSNGGQQITSIGFNYSGLGSQFTDEYLYRSTVAGSLGTQVQNDNSPDGNFGSLTENINGTPVYFYLVVDVANNVNAATTSVTTAPTQANIVVAAGNKNPLSISRTFTFATSQVSDIILNNGTTDNIDYISKRTGNPLSSSNSASLATFQIRDGGGTTDSDNASTTLTGFQIQLSGTAAGTVRRIALFDGGSIIAGTQQDVSGTTITWSGLSLSAGDGGTKDFTVRATFISTPVADNSIVDVTIQSATVTASASGSGFTTITASSASAASADANKIEVTATALTFTGNPPNTTKDTPFPLGIRAIDAQNNIDLDFNGQIALTATGGPGTLTVDAVPPPPQESLTPSLSAGVYDWTTLQLNQSGTYTLIASDDNYDDSFSNPTATVIISSSSSNVNSPTTVTSPICYGTAFTQLNSIIITETDAAGITGTNGNSYTFSIALPTGFVFDPSVATGVTLSGGGDISAASGYTYLSSNTVVQFSFTFNATANINTITISNLKIGRPHPGNNMPGNTPPPAISGATITRAGGSANIAGITAGTVLGTVSVAQPAGIAEFTVDELSGDVNVDPGTTSFNINANSVKLSPSISTPPGSNSFGGSGVTFVNPDYRFNPNSLSPGAYNIAYTNTDGSGCQKAFIKTFTVFVSGINGLDPAYCNNAPAATGLTVDQTFVDQRMIYYNTRYGTTNGTWKFDYFVYYDPNIGNFTPITYPSNDEFDPKYSVYQNIVQVFGGEMPVGFAVCNTFPGSSPLPIGTPIVPCAVYMNPSPSPAAGSGFGVFDTYQWVTINSAPSPTFTLPKTTFCLDDPAVILTGTPPNSDATLTDFFSATEITSPFAASPSGTITVSSPPTAKVWSFNPGSLGVGSADIVYTYKNPSTGCVGTSAKTRVTVNSRPGPLVPADITSLGVLGNTTPATCQGDPVGTFLTTNALTLPNKYTWYDDAALTTEVGSGNSFAPPNPPVNPNVPTGVPHDFYVTQTINGCESNKQLVSPPPALKLEVTIKPSPAAPTPNFTDSPGREFCVGSPINLSTLVVPGTGVKWYTPGTSTVVATVSNPTLANLSIPDPTLGPAVYDYEVTQTVALCESPRTPVRVRIKALPTLSVSAGAADPLKICTEGGHDGGSGTLITFSGSDENGPVVTGSWTSTPAMTLGALIDGGGTALLSTPTLIPGNYTLRFDHQNASGCSNFINVPVTVLPRIKPSLAPLDTCFGSFVKLENTSKLQTGPLASTDALVTDADVVATKWGFNDNGLSLDFGSGPVNANGGRTKGTYLNPEHNFVTLGLKSVTYEMRTTYCSYTGTELLTVNPKPEINFIWRNPCFDSAANRTTTRFFANEVTSPSPLAIAKYDWNFKVNGTLDTLSITNRASANPIVNYNKTGVDAVQLIAITAAQCRDTLQKVVYALPTYKAITDTTGYDQNFNSGSNFWLTGGVRSSWALGSTTPVAIPPNGASWATGLSSSNNADEQSWVMSGCFNFSDSKKPVISLDIWSDTPDGVDGAVLQFNEDGRIENEGSWQVLGDASSGINWYDGSGISNSPGNQSSNDYGWTGTYAGWKKAIYKLDAVKPPTPLAPDSLIVFRVAFAGGNRQLSGFAFDNVFVGERSRVVLLENFTNTVPISTNVALTTNHNAIYESFGNVSTNELVKIQYHTPFPGDDELNKQNQQMNNSRAAFYGITEAPTARVDGGFQAGNLGSWLTNYNDSRVLTPSALAIDTTSITKVGTDVKINLSIENTTSQKLPLDGVNVFTVIVQKQIDKAGNESLFGNIGNTQFVYVAKQMLPTAAGIPLSDSLAIGVPLPLPEITWSNPNGGDAIVIFVQRIDGDNKNVYQAILVKNPPLPEVITGVGENDEYKHVTLYPNPANHEMNIQLPAAVNKATPVALYDAFGRVVYQTAFNVGEQTKTVSTSTFADGIYIMQLITPQGTKVVRKVMVTHR